MYDLARAALSSAALQPAGRLAGRPAVQLSLMRSRRPAYSRLRSRQNYLWKELIDPSWFSTKHFMQRSEKRET